MFDSVAESNAADLKRAKRARKPSSAALDLLPPHSIEMEQCVLGCILLSPVESLKELIGTFKRDTFYDLRHQAIYSALIEMHNARQVIDVITLHQYLKDKQLLDQIGGVSYLSTLPDTVPSAANLSYYADIVQEKYKLRQIVNKCTEVVSQVYSNTGDITELLYSIGGDLREIFEPQTPQRFEIFSIDDLDEFDLDNDPDNLVGRRYATKGSSIVINGPSGRGKSSLLMLRIILWALGKNFYGMKVLRPLSFVVWQTENNKGDLAKAFQGAVNFLGLNSFEHQNEFEMLRKNIVFTNCSGLLGQQFLSEARRFLENNKKDFAVLDPLVSFPEGDLNGAMGAGDFLRKGLSRLSKENGVGWIINHHTPKPLRDPNAQGFKKRISDYQYSGAGSFDIPGWSRAVETLEEASDGIFRLILAKRGDEAGACHPDGTPTKILWLRHAISGGIHWEQMDPPEEVDHQSKDDTPKLTKPQQIATCNLGTFISACPTEGEGLREIMRRLKNWLGSKDSPQKSLAASEGSIRKAIGLLLDNDKLTLSDGRYFKGPNA